MAALQFSRYRALGATPDAPWFSFAGWFGRLPRSAMSLAVLLLVASRTGSFALAGAVAAAFVVGLSVSGPLWSRAMDRWGQTPVLRLGLLSLLAATLLLVGAIELDLPVPIWIGAALLAGASAPDVGAAVRSRWTAHSAPESRPAAFALESTVDESLFVVAPPLITLAAAAFGASWALLAAAAVGGVGLLALSALRRSMPVPVRRARVSLRPPAGIVPAALSCVGIGAMFGAFDVTSIAWGDRLGAPWAGGLMMAALAVGNTLGALASGAMPPRSTPFVRWLRLAVVLAVAAIALPFGGMSFGLGVVVVTLFGVGVGPLIVATYGVVESRSDRARITEMLAYPAVGMGAGLPLGSILAGLAVDAAGIVPGLAVMAAGAASVLLVGAVGEATLRLTRRMTSARLTGRQPLSPADRRG